MRRGRASPDDSASEPTSPREDRAGGEGQADRPAPGSSRRGEARPRTSTQADARRPDGRPATRASDDDALVAFQRAIEAPADPFELDESFDAHDEARGIRSRTTRNLGGAGSRGVMRRVAPVSPASFVSPDKAVAASDVATTRSRATHFENADGDQYSRTSEQATRFGRRRPRGPFGARDARDTRDPPDASGQPSAGTEPDASTAAPRDTGRRAAPERPTRSLKGRALGYLSRREYSRSELARKLASYVEKGDDVEAVLDALECDGWLSDARFAESLVHRRASRMGSARILGELKRHALDSTLVESVSEQLRDTEFSRAQAVWRKKFGSLPGSPAERAKQARFLASRGFSSGTIVKLLKGGDDEFGDF